MGWVAYFLVSYFIYFKNWRVTMTWRRGDWNFSDICLGLPSSQAIRHMCTSQWSPSAHVSALNPLKWIRHKHGLIFSANAFIPTVGGKCLDAHTFGVTKIVFNHNGSINTCNRSSINNIIIGMHILRWTQIKLILLMMCIIAYPSQGDMDGFSQKQTADFQRGR